MTLPRPPTTEGLFGAPSGRIAGERAQQPLGQCAERKACDDVARPMGEQHDAAQGQAGTKCPDEIALCARQNGRGGHQRADVHGMTGRESVERLSRKRHAVEMAAHGQAIRPALVEGRLEQMRDHADSKSRQQDMVAVPALLKRAAAAIQPPARGERQQHMFVGAPAKPSSRAFGAGAGVLGNGVRDLNVACGGRNPVGHDHRTPSQGLPGIERLAL
jgi:hypothetical protein